MIFVLRLSNSGLSRAMQPSSVVQSHGMPDIAATGSLYSYENRSSRQGSLQW